MDKLKGKRYEKKKNLSAILCMMIGATAMVGCGDKADSTQAKDGGKVKLRMTNWNNEDTMKDMLKYLSENYQMWK